MQEEQTEKSVLGAWLKKLRNESKLSQPQAGQAIGVSGREIRRWENGETPGGIILLRLLNTYDVRIDPAPPAEIPGAVNAELRALAEAVARADRLEEISAKVEAQGVAMTKALRALATDVRKLALQQAPQAQPATKKRAAG